MGLIKSFLYFKSFYFVCVMFHHEIHPELIDCVVFVGFDFHALPGAGTISFIHFSHIFLAHTSFKAITVLALQVVILETILGFFVLSWESMATVCPGVMFRGATGETASYAVRIAIP